MEKNGIFNTTSSLTNFEIQKYYQNKPRFNGGFSRDNLPKNIKDGACVINVDEFADVGRHWNTLFYKEVKLFVSIVLAFNMFLKKLKSLSDIKT